MFRGFANVWTIVGVARDLGKHREQVHRWLRWLGVDPAAFHR